MKTEFKEGDWCYHDFVLSQILKIEDGCINNVTTGYFSSGGNSTSRCYPLNIDIKLISEEVETIYKRICNLEFNSLNIPEINCELIRMWIHMCDNVNNTNEIKKMYGELKTFYDDIKESVERLRDYKIRGINLYK